MALITDFDWTRVLDRWESWWLGQNEAPLLTAWIPPSQPVEYSPLRTERDWLDFEGRLDRFAREVELTPHFADNVPCFFPNLGPDIAATPWGAKLEFGDDTSWVHPIADSLSRTLLNRFSFDDSTWKKVVSLTELSLQKGAGKWLTGYTDLHLGADLLVSLVGPENLCLDLADDPDLFAESLNQVQNPCLRMLRQEQDRVLNRQGVSLSWLAAPTKGRMHIPSCDFSCLISCEDFQTVILPRIVEETLASDRSIYHLDGPGALRHLDSILEVPSIHAIQWVYGAGSGPARRWTEVYKRIQNAGKSIQIICEEAEDALELSRALEPAGVWYSLPGMSLEDAQNLRSKIQFR